MHVGNFGDLSGLAFHNLIGGASTVNQKRFMGKTLYCIIGQLNESTKNLKRFISICLTKVMSNPSFKQPTTQDLEYGIS
jgi:hypothetical protein